MHSVRNWLARAWHSGIKESKAEDVGSPSKSPMQATSRYPAAAEQTSEQGRLETAQPPESASCVGSPAPRKGSSTYAAIYSPWPSTQQPMCCSLSGRFIKR